MNGTKSDSGSMALQAKLPPQAVDLEMAVLGAIMLEQGAYDRVAEYLKAETFYKPEHQEIYRGMCRLYDAKNGIDLLTVVENLRQNGTLEQVGGPYTITKLTNAVVSSAHIETHARILVERYIKREIIQHGSQLVKDGFDEEMDAFDLVDAAEHSLFQISNGTVKREPVATGELVLNSMAELHNIMQHPQELLGIPSGFRDLDIVTCGWQGPDLIILAARPSVGKTAFALNLAWNAATHPQKNTGVAFFSLEMSSMQLIKRLQTSVSNVPLRQIQRGNIDAQELQKITQASERIAAANLHFDDTAGISIYELRSRVRRYVNKHNVGLVIIDYLQLMNGRDKNDRGGNREQEISNISRSLKALAKELNIPIIALSQINRAAENRKEGPNKFQLSDLRESGAIEQDADFVGFLTRTDYMKPDGTIDPGIKNMAQLQIRKHRNGSLDDVDFRTDLAIQRWYDPKEYDQLMLAHMPMGSWKTVSLGASSFFETNNEINEDMPF